MNNRGGNRAPDAPASPDWVAITRRLVIFARDTHRFGVEDAEQIAQEAVCRYFDGEHARYNPEIHGDLLRFLGSIVNGIVANLRRHERRCSAWLLESGGLVEGDDSPEDHAIAAEHGRLALAKLHRRTRDDALVQRLITAVVFDGIHGPAEQAAHLGVRIQDIYEAWRRLREHIEAVSTSMGDN